MHDRSRLTLLVLIASSLLTIHAFAQDAQQLPDDLKKRLIDEIDGMKKAGEKPKAWLDVFGEKAERPIDGADAKTLTVLVQGNPFPVSWEKLCASDTLVVARSVAQGNGERLLLAAEIALAYGNNDQASDLALQAGQAAGTDAALAEKVKALAARIPAHAATPAATSDQPHTGTPTATQNNGMSTSVVPKRSGSARKERPRVLMDAPRLAAVRAKSGNPDGKRFLNYISKGVTDQESIAYPLAYLMTNDEQYSRQAMDIIQKYVDRGPLKDLNQIGELGFSGIVYDWCHDKLSEDKRKTWQTWMLKSYDNYKDQYMVGYHNYMMRCAWAFALVGYALEGDNPRAAELIANAYTQRWAKKILPACKAGLAGGAWAEGEGYGSTTAIALLELAEAARCAEGKDLYSEAPEFFAGRLAFEMFLEEPGVTDGGRRLWRR